MVLGQITEERQYEDACIDTDKRERVLRGKGKQLLVSRSVRK
jgi:hypothetical protein